MGVTRLTMYLDMYITCHLIANPRIDKRQYRAMCIVHAVVRPSAIRARCVTFAPAFGLRTFWIYRY